MILENITRYSKETCRDINQINKVYRNIQADINKYIYIYKAINA